MLNVCAYVCTHMYIALQRAQQFNRCCARGHPPKDTALKVS